MQRKLSIGSITADVTQKRIKRINLRITVPDGELRITAPLRMSLQRIHDFALSKLGWILKHQTRLRHTRKMIVAHDPHVMLLWGKPHKVVQVDASGPSRVRLVDGEVHVQLRAASPKHKQRAMIDAWQHKVMLVALRTLLNKWEPIMGVEVARVTVQRMTTRWGSCTPLRRRIRLNLELLSRPPDFLEYVVVHELAHFFERGHGPRFKAVMDKFLPDWRRLRAELNSTAL